jgi:hypothetical protein
LRALVVIGLALGLATSSVNAKPVPWFSRSAGECGWVHGKFGFANGSMVRSIWVIGTNHMLAMSDTDFSEPREIDPLNRRSPYYPKKFFGFLYGDFRVCAVIRYKPEHMQIVRILKVRKTFFQP